MDHYVIGRRVLHGRRFEIYIIFSMSTSATDLDFLLEIQILHVQIIYYRGI